MLVNFKETTKKKVYQNLSKGLGFSKEDRDENIRRVGFVCHLLSRNGTIALMANIAPYISVREEIYRLLEYTLNDQDKANDLDSKCDFYKLEEKIPEAIEYYKRALELDNRQDTRGISRYLK